MVWIRINASKQLAFQQLVLRLEGKQTQICARLVEIIAKQQLTLVVRRMLTAPLELYGLSFVALQSNIGSTFFAPELIEV